MDRSTRRLRPDGARPITKGMDPYRPLDDAALTLAAELAGASHGALATQLDGAPFVSRAACLWIADVGPTLLLSDLSEHARALKAEPRCSLMVGEAGSKGDPLTHPRLTLVGTAVVIDKDKHAADWRESRPKTALYYPFTDFRLYRLDPGHAVLNGGFGQAYRLTATDVMSARRSGP